MDQQFSLSWNNFHGNLSKGFAGLLGKGEFVDVTIAVDGHLLQAHKVILSICSPYFKKMFQLNPCQHPIVVLRDVSHKAMRDLLQFMYHGEVSVKREDLTSFIGTAEVLQIKGLTNKEIADDEVDSEPELPNQDNRSHKNNAKEIRPTPEPIDNTPDNQSQNNTTNNTELLKHKEFIDKLQRLTNLKRKSEEFIQNNFYNDITNLEKRPKFKEKNAFNSLNINHVLPSTYDQLRNIYEERAPDTNAYNNHISPVLCRNSEDGDKSKLDQSISSDSPVECKTEYDDEIGTEATLSSPKSYEEQKGPINYQTVQDNCSGLSSLFMDLKNLVNGKMGNVTRMNNPEELSHGFMDHRLVTIPQKEDGKKKYPQRSCRLCWKLGKRRDTRFMCHACELPFCKNPCFEIHFNDVVKTSHLNTDYFAN